MFKKFIALSISLITLIAAPAWAQTAAPTLNSGDTAWVLTASLLVLMMSIPGLALFYGGLVRSKNVLSVLMQCFTIVSLITVLWLVYGYSLAFSTGGMEAGDAIAAPRVLEPFFATYEAHYQGKPAGNASMQLVHGDDGRWRMDLSLVGERGIAGATLSGDGSVVLVLDMEDLLEDQATSDQSAIRTTQFLELLTHKT